ncbi:MAG: hypothetical protein KAT70_10010 [Thermoplasmata archaeon]|nr:hypothetical protein [Thermoplasmata archaeon]
MIAKEELMRHFLFHKSIVDEEDTGKLDDYIQILGRVEDGRYNQIEDRWERTATTVLELMVQENLDPWDIDLARFSKAYRKQLKKRGVVDLISAGRLTFLAWSILADKASSLKHRAEEPPQILEEFPFTSECAPWELFTPEDPYAAVTESLLEDPPIQPCIMHEERRKVGLVDLMEAFDEARREADLMVEIQKVRERLRKQQNPRLDITQKLHKENLEEDITRVWRALSGINKDKVTMEDLFIRDREEFVSVFVALLFLSREGKIELKQTRFPRGKITIKLLAPYEERISLMEIGSITPEIEVPTLEDSEHELEEPIMVTA